MGSSNNVITEETNGSSNLEITLGTMKDYGNELAEFLEPRVGTKPSVSGSTLTAEDSSIRPGIRFRHVKTYIKRFMYMKGIKQKYRVFVSGNELAIQEIEFEEKGKEEEKETKKEEKVEKIIEEKESSKEEAESTEREEQPRKEKKVSKSRPRKKKAQPED